MCKIVLYSPKNLGFVRDFVQETGGTPLCFAGGMGINVHRRIEVRVAEKLLHILRRRTFLQEVGRVGVAQHMKMKMLHPREPARDFFAGLLHQVRRGKRPVLLPAD